VVAGNLLIVAIHWDRASTFTSLTDTQSNTWNLAGSEVDNAGAGLVQKSRVYYAIANSSAANTVSVTVSGTVFRYISVHEYSVTTTFDTSAGTTGTGGTLTSASFTVAQNSSLLFAFGVCSGTGSAAGGYNSRQTNNGDITEDTTANAGSQTATATQTGTSDYTIHAAVFNSGAAAAAALPHRMPLGV
jgi:hypothetical protein